MNDTVLDNGGDVWTLAKMSDGAMHYATFRWIKDAKTSKEFTIEFSSQFNHSPIWVTVKVAREEWNTLVEAGWTRTHRQNRSVAPQQVASRSKREPYGQTGSVEYTTNYALEA
mgnify:FL=1